MGCPSASLAIGDRGPGSSSYPSCRRNFNQSTKITEPIFYPPYFLLHAAMNVHRHIKSFLVPIIRGLNDPAFSRQKYQKKNCRLDLGVNDLASPRQEMFLKKRNRRLGEESNPGLSLPALARAGLSILPLDHSSLFLLNYHTLNLYITKQTFDNLLPRDDCASTDLSPPTEQLRLIIVP